MLDIPLNGLDTLKHVALVRGSHVTYPPGWSGHVKSRGSSSGQPCSISPLRGLDTLNSRFRSGHPRIV
eukprot:9199748-Pyramimonas_sp.AAC.1